MHLLLLSMTPRMNLHLQVCSGPALELLSGDELELAMCGTTQLNFEDLESVARYEGGYNQQSPTIKNLWAVLHRFSLEEKQMFLKYTTGSHRCDSVNCPPAKGRHCIDLLVQMH